MRDRIEVNVLDQIKLMREAQATLPRNALVLDAGAGEGRYKGYFEHTRYIAYDFGQGDEGWNYGSLDCVGDLHALPFEDGAFDGVVCTQVLEHVRFPERVMGELTRVLKRGGHLYLSAPQGWHQHQKPHDYFRFTSFALDAMFRAQGLVPQSIRPMGGYFWALSYELQMMHYWLFPSQEKGLQRSVWGLLGSLAVRALFLFLAPLPLYYLDKFDKLKDKTMGYVCHCTKP
jgi:SAM-dependent methyltransferase